MAKLTELETELLEALRAAHDHLEYSGYGDKWEMECAEHNKLPEKIQAALKKAEEKLAA